MNWFYSEKEQCSSEDVKASAPIASRHPRSLIRILLASLALMQVCEASPVVSLLQNSFPRSVPFQQRKTKPTYGTVIRTQLVPPLQNRPVGDRTGFTAPPNREYYRTSTALNALDRVVSDDEDALPFPNSLNLRYLVHFDPKTSECKFITPEWDINSVQVSSYEDCLMMVEGFEHVKTNFDVLEQASEDYPDIQRRMKTALDHCISSPLYPDLNAQSIVRYDHRVKEFKSLNDKIFNRIQSSKKYNSKFVYEHNINDVIGFRILTPDSIQSAQLMECLKTHDALHITNSRSRDGLVYYASGELPTTMGLNGKKQLYEIQIWPFGVGDWMIWQHGLYYKGDAKVKPLLKAYKDSVEDAGRCLSQVDFYQQVFPTLADKSVSGVYQWIRDNCIDFLNQQEVKSSRGKDGLDIQLDAPSILKPEERAKVIEAALRMAAERAMLKFQFPYDGSIHHRRFPKFYA